MGTLDALLAGIVAEPLEETRWLVLADWLEEHDDPRRAELLRLHRRLLATCCEPEKYPERAAWHSRILNLIGEGVRPCVPQHTLKLPGGVALVGSFIPPGTFLMGGTVVDEEQPVHRVMLTRGFFLGTCLVTQSQWRAVMETQPSHFKGKNRPVEQVSWDDCQEFCQNLTESLNGRIIFRLPSEAEWEYACRAGTTTEFHFGNVIKANLANFDGHHSWNGSPKGKRRNKTTDAGSFRSNPWGLFDMHGNVWQWCQDAWDEAFYQKSPLQDPICNSNKCIDISSYVLRGGSWVNLPQYCRAAFRFRHLPAIRYNSIGFRVAFRLD